MARIELRDATFRVVDGHSNTAAVNKVTPAAGDTNLDVDTLGTSGVLPPSARFTIAGSTRTYRITAQEGGSKYTVTFTGATTGNITLKAGTHSTSANILYSANAAAVKAAIVATGVDAADVTVLQSAGLWTITFTGSLNAEVTALVATGVSLTDGTDPVVPVVAAVHPGAATYNITFTPALAVADGVPADDAVITVGGRTVEVKIGDGNFTYTENSEYDYQLDRGDLDAVREGNQVPMDVSFDFVWEFITAIEGSGNPTVSDALKHRGEAADWVSSSADQCEPYAVDIEIEHEAACGNEQSEIHTFPDFRVEKLTPDLGKASIAASGRCNATEPIIVRVAA